MNNRPRPWPLLLASCVFLVVASGPARATIPVIEREALIALYSGWNGEPGTECSWYGVTCNADGTSVIGISLVRNYYQVTSPLPPEIGDFPNLIQLFLANNRLSGPIPPEIGNLSNLHWLHLSKNDLSGPIPPEIGNLSNLKRLYLDQNKLSGSIPAEIGDLMNLEFLGLHRNDLTGSIPPEIDNLMYLELLDLHRNYLTGPIPLEIGNLTDLVHLDLSTNWISSAIPSEIGQLSGLSSLILGGNRLFGSIPPEIGNLGNLEYLNIQGNQINGEIPPEIGNLGNLRHLVLRNNRLTCSIPPEIGNLSNLATLYLSKNRLSGPIPLEVGHLPGLYFLSIDSNRLVGELPTSLMNLTNLHRLFLRNNALFTTDPTLEVFLEQDLVPGWIGETWIDSQTLAPKTVVVTAVSDHAVWLSWDTVTYDDPGGYELFVSPVGTDSWTSARWTADKDTTTFPVTGLVPETSYEFAVASFTDPHEHNQNWVLSEAGEPVMATTSNLGCAAPTIIASRGGEITLSLDGAYDTYLWSTGENTPVIVVDPESPDWYWVTVTFAGACEETASVLVGPGTSYVRRMEVE